MIFLIEYDRLQGLLVSLKQFTHSERHDAEEARLRLELSANGGTDREIVLLEAATEDALRRTHRRYFERVEELLNSAGPNGEGRGPSG